MNLAVVVDTFPRWSEQFIARELVELKRHRIEFSIFCLKAGDEDPESKDLITHRIVLPSCIMPRLTKESGSAALKERRALAKEKLGVTGYAKVRCAESLGKILREQKFTHVHAHFASLPSTIGWLAAVDAGLPFSFSVHARDLFVEPQLLEHKLADCVRVFTCHAHADAALRKQTAHKNKVALMHHGLPLDEFPYREHRPSGLPPHILAAGRFVVKKGFDDLIAAAATEPLAGMNFCIALLGEGPEQKKLAAQIKKLKLAEKVAIHAPLRGHALREIFESADIFAAPYREAKDGDVDGVPNVILEAFALGIPVIGTHAGGVGEVLTSSTGTVVPSGDPKALAKAIAAHLKNPESAVAKSKAARKLIEQNFDIQKNIEPLLRLLS